MATWPEARAVDRLALWALGAGPWDRPTGERVEQELWRLAQEMLRLGLSVVLDVGLWARDERDAMRTVAREMGVGAELHFLDVAPDELWHRVGVRDLAPPWDARPIRCVGLAEWLAILERLTSDELASFDLAPS